MRDVSAYCVDGVQLRSVTEILGDAFGNQYSGIPPGVLAKASARGTRADAYCSVLDYGLKPNHAPDEEIKPYVDAYRQFVADTGFECLFTDKTVLSKKYQFAGTLDCAGYLKYSSKPDDLFVIDRKCVVKLSPLTALQTAGYAIALEEQEVLTVKRRAALQLKKDGTYKIAQYHRDGDRADFLAACRVAHFATKHKLTPER